MNTEYDVRWESQSRNSADSMPVGGYDCGANVWVENDDLLLYMDRSGSFDENNQMLKLGRLRLRFQPCPFRQRFVQRLRLELGCVTVEGDNGFCAEVWFHTDSPTLRIDVRSDVELTLEASYETWRFEETPVSDRNSRAAFSYHGYPSTVITYPDRVTMRDDGITFCHENRNDKLVFDFLVEQQGLQPIKEQQDNPQKDFIFGGRLTGDGLTPTGVERGKYAETPYLRYTLRGQPSTEQHLAVCFFAAQCSPEAWQAQITALCARQLARTDARQCALDWWRAFWQRSHIRINADAGENDEGFRIGRNYALMRYMLGCNAYGEYPSKFNGGLFTVDPLYSVGEEFHGETPDYRRWGGGSFTAQNQRLVYWPLLKSGDFDMMPPQFDYYRRALRNAERRTRFYWGHDGCCFPEQVESFGLPVGICYGFPQAKDPLHVRPPFMARAELRCPWTRYEYVTQLEFAYMILEYHRYAGESIERYLPFIRACVRFFAEHYEMRHTLNTRQPLDGDGHWCIWPSTALETYKDAKNPTDVLSALRAVIEGLIELSDKPERAEYVAMLAKIPPLKTRVREGVECIAPAWEWTENINDELPQLYPVFPYGQYGLGRDDLALAVQTYWHGVDEPRQRGYVGWRQDVIFAARLGLTDEAARLMRLKLGDGPLRFPAFWGGGFDWTPDHNWGGSGMIGLQEMLVQAHETDVRLLPAWPLEWRVECLLHLPNRASVSVAWNGDTLTWRVSAPDRTLHLPDGTISRAQSGAWTKPQAAGGTYEQH